MLLKWRRVRSPVRTASSCSQLFAFLAFPIILSQTFSAPNPNVNQEAAKAFAAERSMAAAAEDRAAQEVAQRAAAALAARAAAAAKQGVKCAAAERTLHRPCNARSMPGPPFFARLRSVSDVGTNRVGLTLPASRPDVSPSPPQRSRRPPAQSCRGCSQGGRARRAAAGSRSCRRSQLRRCSRRGGPSPRPSPGLEPSLREPVLRGPAAVRPRHRGAHPASQAGAGADAAEQQREQQRRQRPVRRLHAHGQPAPRRAEQPRGDRQQAQRAPLAASARDEGECPCPRPAVLLSPRAALDRCWRAAPRARARPSDPRAARAQTEQVSGGLPTTAASAAAAAAAVAAAEAMEEMRRKREEAVRLWLWFRTEAVPWVWAHTFVRVSSWSSAESVRSLC